jgi:uncharacterized membrane protein YkvA (DUF1232 family)
MNWKKLFFVATATSIKTLVLALWILVRHPRTPWLAKAVAVAVVTYAVSPIDLIPDFIPVLGQLDDLILVPLGVALAIRLVPRALWDECLLQAEARVDKLPRLVWGAVAIVALWLLLLAAFVVWLVRAAAG